MYYNLYLYYFHSCSTKLFVRWMNGTCIECLPQKVEGEDELYVFTFFTDISVNNETIDLVQSIHYNIKNTLTNMQRYLNRWKKYRSIWKVDKVSVLTLISETLCSLDFFQTSMVLACLMLLHILLISQDTFTYTFFNNYTGCK